MKDPIFASTAPFRKVFCSCETAAKLQSVKIPNFAAKAPFRRVFCSCEMAAKHKNSQFCSQSSILQGISRLRNHFLAHECHFVAPNTHFRTAKSLLSSEMASKLRNSLQIVKLTYEMEESLQKHLTKPREVAKIPTEPHDHTSEEESPAHPGITHTKPLTPFLTSLNHQSP